MISRTFLRLVPLLLMLLPSSGLSLQASERTGSLFEDVKYWQGFLSDKTLSTFLEAYDRGIDVMWPACHSRSRTPKSEGLAALSHDICRGNALYILDLLRTAGDKPGSQDAGNPWVQLNRLLNFRDELRSARSYVSLVLIDAIERYVLVEMMEQTFEQWSSDEATRIYSRFKATTIDLTMITDAIRLETGRSVGAAARAYADDFVPTDANPRQYSLDYFTFWGIAYMAEREDLTPPIDSKALGATIDEHGIGTSVGLLANRDLTALMGRMLRADYDINVSAFLFLEFVRYAPKPSGEINLQVVREALRGRDLPQRIFAPLNYFDSSRAAEIAQTLRYLSDGTFGSRRRGWLWSE